MSTPNTQIKQHPERAVPAETLAFLEKGMVANIGFVEDGIPYVIPMSYHFVSGEHPTLYLHGNNSSRMLAVMCENPMVCVSVTLLDGLVYSRNALNHSMNYRSAVCFGKAEKVDDNAEKRRLFEDMTLRYFPGRTVGEDYHGATEAQLNATTVVAIRLTAQSGKQRKGGATGALDGREGVFGTFGVVEMPGVHV